MEVLTINCGINENSICTLQNPCPRGLRHGIHTDSTDRRSTVSYSLRISLNANMNAPLRLTADIRLCFRCLQNLGGGTPSEPRIGLEA